MADAKGCTVAVAFRTPLDADLCALLVASLVKFLLYMRGQVPCMYDELERIVADYREQQQQGRALDRSAARGAMRKALKCVDAVDHVLREGLPAVFAGRVQTVAIVFGASLLSPREAVVVDFGGVARVDLMDIDRVGADPNAAASHATTILSSQSLAKEKLGRLCAQKLLRALIVDGACQRTSDLAITRVHIAVLAAKQHARPIPGFQPKQNFSLRFPKSNRGQEERTHWIRLSTVSADDNGVGTSDVSINPSGVATINTEQGSLSSLKGSCGGDGSFIWYVLEKPIHGFAGAL